MIYRIKTIIDSIDVGENVTLDVKVKSHDIKPSTKGSPYGDLVLGDSESEISAKCWNISEASKLFLKENKYVRITGEVNLFNGKQIIVKRMLPIPEDELDLVKLEKTAPESESSLIEYLEKCIEDIEDKAVKTIVSRRWLHNKERFVKWPAAKTNHHNYLNGLLYHTVSMLRLATNNLRQYPGMLDKDILYGAIILHDMDKVREYASPDNPVFTELGELYGHIFMSSAETYHEAKLLYNEDKDIDLSKVKYVIHAILAHHGKLEWGSPVVPKTIEAEIIHQIDNMDAKLNSKYK